MKLHPDQIGHHRPFVHDPRRYKKLKPSLRATLSFAAKGLTNKEIAARRFRTEKTIKNHMWELAQVFGTDTRTAMVLEAIRHGDIACPCGHSTVRPQRLKRPAPRRRLTPA